MKNIIFTTLVLITFSLLSPVLVHAEKVERFDINSYVVPRMNELIIKIHEDIMKKKDEYEFLTDYDDDCLKFINEKATIAFFPKKDYSNKENGIVDVSRAMPSQAQINYLPIDFEYGGRYKRWNVFEDGDICKFPDLKSKLEGMIGLDNQEHNNILKEIISVSCESFTK